MAGDRSRCNGTARGTRRPLVRTPRYLLIPLLILAGCSSLRLNSSIPFVEEKPQQPASLAAIWQDTALAQPNQPPKRGFLGRLVFYGEKGGKPIRVEGTLVVYAFEENGGGPEKVKPDRKYVFTPEQFAEHHTKCDLGHAYNVFVEWDAAGGPRKEISLIARFLPKTGGAIVSEQSRHLLPGENVLPGPRGAQESGAPYATAGENPVRPASYEAPISQRPESAEPGLRPKMLTTTIQVPPGFERHLPMGGDIPGANRPAPGTNANPRSFPGEQRGSTTDPVKASRAEASSSAQDSPAAAQQPGQAQTWPFQPRSTGFPPPRPRDLGGDIAPPTRDRVPWRLGQAESRPPRETAP